MPEKIQLFFQEYPVVLHAAKLMLVLLLSIVAHFVTKRIIIRVVSYLATKTKFTWDDVVVKRGVFNKLALLAPAMVFYYFAGWFPTGGPIMQRAISGYAMFVLALAASDFLNAVNEIYDRYPFAKGRPIKGYLQVVKLIIYIFVGVAIFGTMFDKSPAVLLSGLGAMTAVLLLIFKDTILSLVASIQVAANDMIRIGDWVEMPSANADGDVIDIALHVVKIQNWDKTITTVPTHKFVSESFRNWRGMSESGGRRIKRSIAIDQNAIRFMDEALFERLSKIQLLEGYLTERKAEIDAYNAERAFDPESPVNGRHMTNLGTFREYTKRYVQTNPNVHKEMTLLVRQLASGPSGIGIEIYCFSAIQTWADYEAIQGDIFDHLLAILPQFDLRVFQQPSGRDFSRLAPQVELRSPA